MRTSIVALVLTSIVALAAPLAPAAGAASAAGGDRSVRIVNLNLLHGAFCPQETNGCRAPDRVTLLMQQLEAAKCPEIVGLQEINANLAKLIGKAVPKTCDGKYEIVFGGKPRTIDTERVLTTLPVRSTKVIKLGVFRTASRAVLKSPIGPLVLVVTHQDGDPVDKSPGPPCRNCPPPCKAVQANTYACQTVASADLADSTGGANATRVLMGDFNFTSTNPRYQSLVADGWQDTYLLAGNPECDPATAVGCSSGRDDKTLESLQDPTKRQVERIDFIFVKAPPGCTVATDPVGDPDGDGVGTGLWNDEPTTNGPGGLAWTSDHTGVSADLTCGT
ncbi:MAG TPA: endonuclease/exonuclease/phosphatase family protein [Acidimicrobiia bacterium]